MHDHGWMENDREVYTFRTGYKVLSKISNVLSTQIFKHAQVRVWRASRISYDLGKESELDSFSKL